MRLHGRLAPAGPVVQGRTYTKDPATSDKIKNQRLEFMQSKFGEHPDLLEKMCPAYPPNASRPVLVDAHYERVRRPVT